MRNQMISLSNRYSVQTTETRQIISSTAQHAPTKAVIEESGGNIIMQLTDHMESSKNKITNAFERSRLSIEESIKTHIDRRLIEPFSNVMSGRLESHMFSGPERRQVELNPDSASLSLDGSDSGTQGGNVT